MRLFVYLVPIEFPITSPTDARPPGCQDQAMDSAQDLEAKAAKASGSTVVPSYKLLTIP